MPCIGVVVGLLAFFAAPAAASAPPADTWVGLDSGQLGSYLWEVKAKRQPDADAGGSTQPCLLVGTTWKLGPYSYKRSKYRACAGAEGQLTASEAPLIATGVQPSSGDSVKMTAVGMIFAPAARKVRITLAGGRQETVQLHRFSPSQARAAKLSRFEFAAFAFHGLWCAERMVSQTATGRVLWDSGTDEFGCSATGSRGTSFDEE